MTRSSTEPTEWLYCGRDATARDRVGCRGCRIPGHEVCLAHLSPRKRRQYLANLAPGADIDHRGTTFTEPLLKALLGALHDPATGNARFGLAEFSGAQFSGKADFSDVQFSGAWFFEAKFTGKASFEKAQFSGIGRFSEAHFSREAEFSKAQFRDA
jgi:uncharacterized protein YjbI with pentapeptide repeats